VQGQKSGSGRGKDDNGWIRLRDWGIHDASEGWWPEMKRSAIKASDLGDSREEMID
jgi:hypothetical protein